MPALFARQVPLFSPDGGFAPEFLRARASNPALAVLVKWDARHRMRCALRRLSPEAVRDMGLDAQYVRDEVMKPFWRD